MYIGKKSDFHNSHPAPPIEGDPPRWVPEVIRIALPLSKRLKADIEADWRAAEALTDRLERPAARKSGFTEQELIEQYKRGDKDAGWELVCRYREKYIEPLARQSGAE